MFIISILRRLFNYLNQACMHFNYLNQAFMTVNCSHSPSVHVSHEALSRNKLCLAHVLCKLLNARHLNEKMVTRNACPSNH